MTKMSKIVDFTYCKKCKFKNTDDFKEPCHECLLTTARDDTHKPLKFVAMKITEAIKNLNRREK